MYFAADNPIESHMQKEVINNLNHALTTTAAVAGFPRNRTPIETAKLG